MPKSLAVFLLLASLTIALTSHSQTTSRNYMSHAPAPADVIDGAKTPNLIPDLAAWRLWLLSVTAEDAREPELAVVRRHAFLRKAGIDNDEMVIADEILSHFKADYASITEQYNKLVKTEQGPSLDEFRAHRDALVQATRTSLSEQLAPRIATTLKQFVIAEKSKMKVAKEER